MTAAYHLQLTSRRWPDLSVAAWVPSASLLLSGPGGCSPRRRLPGGASSRYRGGRASSPWSTLPAGTPRRRSPVSSMRCPPIRFGVRDPAVQPSGVRSPGVVVQRVRRSAVCCPPVQVSSRPAVSRPLSTRPVSSRLVSAPSVRTRPSPPTSGGGVGDQVEVAGHRDHRNGWRPRWLPGRRRLDRRSRRPGRGRRCRSRVGQWEVGGGPGRRVGCRPRRPRLPLSDQAGQAGCGAPVAGGCAVGTGAGCSARWPHPPRGCRPRLGGDHGGWSSPSLTPGWADPEGPLEVPAGMGVRPQRGPSRQASAPGSVLAAL